MIYKAYNLYNSEGNRAYTEIGQIFNPHRNTIVNKDCENYTALIFILL